MDCHITVILVYASDRSVSARETSEVFFEGHLERGVIPDASTWLAGQGQGEEGFVFILEKMNLELLQK
jgi:hypothetical protein